MTDKDVHARGMELLEKIDGRSGIEALRKLDKIAPDFGRMVVEHAFGKIYSRSGLDIRSREIASLAALTALGHARPQLKTHVHGALNAGLSRDEIVEILIHASIFTGFPAALNALFAAGEVFDELDSDGAGDG